MRTLIVFATAVCMAASAQAQTPTLTMESGSVGGATDMAAKHLAEVAAKKKIATIQAQAGKVLAKSILQVAQGKTDLAANPFVLQFLMSKGLGPYSGLGREKGKELAGNLRLLYPYHLAHYYLIAFSASGIDSWDKLKGKTVFNGPPRGGALTTARALIRLTTGMNEGKGYTGKQIAWGQADSIFLDGAVNAAVRPGTNPCGLSAGLYRGRQDQPGFDPESQDGGEGIPEVCPLSRQCRLRLPETRSGPLRRRCERHL